MQAMVNRQVIEHAFSADANLKKRVYNAIRDTPHHVQLFEDIARYTDNRRNEVASNGIVSAADEPSSKKRRLDNGQASNLGPARRQDRPVMFESKDVSFSIPLRKKLNLELIHGLRVEGKNSPTTAIIQIRNPTSKEIEYFAEASAFEHVLRLPVPEKAQKQFNFCLIPFPGVGAGHNALAIASTNDPLVWTVNDGPVKSVQVYDPEMRNAIGDVDSGILERALDFAMRGRGTKVVVPSEAEFVSATPEAHRKGEKAYHVKAFKGSKDGYLFFLSTGIFFGFKKPLQFFAFDDINSISYTSVLQRTFNLNISYKADELDQEEEFSMIDQANFAGIDAYIKRHELQDASMAEKRKAKKVNVNGGKKGAESQQGENIDGPGELQKAEQEIEDAEDEEEEDYDPGSEGESEGSGSSSEEEEDGGGAADDGNIVEEELGSEAEDVEPDPDDDDQL